MPGERYGRYEVRREIGRGGMGVVYLAHDPAVGRDVAVKVLPAGLPGDDHVIARLRQEARLTAALDHACIVPVYDVGEQGDRPFLVMRYMPGGTVHQWLQQGRLSLRRAAEILQRVASALAAAHAQGIIHRDLKPSNILFDSNGDAYLSDFGIAKALAGSLNVSLTGTSIVGTPAYMSPEQAVGDKAIDGRSDTYALGAMAFELLTGRQPYTGDTPMRVVLRHIQDPAPRLTPDELTGLGLPPEVGTALTRAMAKDPADRFDSPLDFAQILATAVGLPNPAATTQRAAPVISGAPAEAVQPVLRPDLATLSPSRSSRWASVWVGLAGLGVVAVLAGLLALNTAMPFGMLAPATPTASPTASPSPTRPASPTSRPTVTQPPSTATPAPTRTAAPTSTTRPTHTATVTLPAPTRRSSTAAPTRAPATATSAPVTAVPPTSVPPTSAPPQPTATQPSSVDPPTPAPPEPTTVQPTPAPP